MVLSCANDPPVRRFFIPGFGKQAFPGVLPSWGRSLPVPSHSLLILFSVSSISAPSKDFRRARNGPPQAMGTS
jgi:hypothetical protein